MKDIKLEDEIAKLQENQKTIVKYEGLKILLKKKGGVIIASAKHPFFLSILSIVVFYFLLNLIGSLISFTYTDSTNMTHMFSGTGFLISVASKYPIIFFATIIIGGIFISKEIYKRIKRKKIKKFSSDYLQK